MGVHFSDAEYPRFEMFALSLYIQFYAGVKILRLCSSPDSVRNSEEFLAEQLRVEQWIL